MESNVITDFGPSDLFLQMTIGIVLGIVANPLMMKASGS